MNSWYEVWERWYVSNFARIVDEARKASVRAEKEKADKVRDETGNRRQ